VLKAKKTFRHVHDGKPDVPVDLGSCERERKERTFSFKQSASILVINISE
jgi:hypothetical protein